MFDANQIKEGENIPVEGEIVISVPVVFGLKEHVSLQYAGKLTNVDGSFSLEGVASATLSAYCSRCLKTCHTPISFSFSENFVEKGSKLPDGCEIEYSDSNINIVPALERNLFNNIPMKFVCSETCGGICIRCGRDQSLGKCGCDVESDRAFAEILAKLK